MKEFNRIPSPKGLTLRCFVGELLGGKCLGSILYHAAE